MGCSQIFEYEDYRAYLRNVGPRFVSPSGNQHSLRRWANRLGYRSQRSIGMVLSGFRIPSSEMVSRISRLFEHNSTEHRYFELLVELERRRKRGRPVGDVLEQLERLRPRMQEWRRIDDQIFSYVSEWYHLVVRQLIRTRSCVSDPTAIARRLRGKVPVDKIREAISRMLELGMLREGERGLEAAEGNLGSWSEVPNQARRIHHLQMLDRAGDALMEQPMEEREFVTLTLPFNRARLEEARRRLREFRDSFNAEFDSPEANDVFQLNLQFFSHTEREG